MDPVNLSQPGIAPAPSQTSELSPAQQEALKRLHTATQQFEGVFLGMLMKSMSDTVSKESIFGKQSNAEEMWSGMLDEQRAQAIASSGSLGIAKILENQLKASVLANADTESKAPVRREVGP